MDRRGAGALRPALALLTLAALIPLGGGAAEANKQLVRVAGTVQYQLASRGFTPLFGSFDLPDDATAVTLADSQGLLRLADSSEIDLGAKVRVRVGAFNAVGTGKPNVINVELARSISSYAIRGSQGNTCSSRRRPRSPCAAPEGYLVTGPDGDDFYCASCERPATSRCVSVRRRSCLRADSRSRQRTNPKTAEVKVVTAPCTNPRSQSATGSSARAFRHPHKVDTTGASKGDPLRPVRTAQASAEPTEKPTPIRAISARGYFSGSPPVLLTPTQVSLALVPADHDDVVHAEPRCGRP